MSTEEFSGIKPHYTYRKNDPETRRILGLRPTAIDAAIRDGTLPPPMPLTKFGRACGWTGAQLIAVVQARLDRAEARQANPPKHPPKSKKEAASKKESAHHASKRRQRP